MALPARNDYDPLDDERNAARPHFEVITGGGDTSDPTGELRALRGGDESEDESDQSSGTAGAAGAHGGLRLIRGGKDDREGAVGAAPVKQDEGEGEENNSRFGRLRQKYGAAKSKIGKLTNTKWMIGIGAGGIGIFGVIMLLFLLMGALKVPHAMQNITTYRASRVLARAAVQNDRTMRSYVINKAADTRIATGISERYSNSRSKTYIDKVSNQLSPNKVISNLGANQGLMYNVDSKGRLVGITLGDRTLLKPQVSFGKKLIPFYSFSKDVKFANEYQKLLRAAYRAEDAGMIARGKAGTKLAQQAGLKRTAWKVVSYKNKTQTAARLLFTRDSAKAIATENNSKAVSPNIQNAVDEANKENAATLQDDDRLLKAVTETDGVDPKVEEAIKNGAKTSAYQKALGFVNTSYAVAAPLCIIYDASINETSTAETIEANTIAQQRAYAFDMAAADQIKDGNSASMEAVEAANATFGDISDSPSEQIAAGKPPKFVGAGSPQSGSGGIYTAFSAVFGQNKATDIVNGGADEFCQKLLDPVLAGVLAVGNIGLLFVPGAGQGITAAGRAATTVVTKAGEKAVVKFGLSAAKQNVQALTKGKTKRFLTIEAGKASSLMGAALLTQMAVANKAGQINSANGLEQGVDRMRTSDSGAELTYNEMLRLQHNGRPLSNPEVGAANSESLRYVAQQNSKKSVFERYASIHNPNSLLTRMGSTVMNTTPAQVFSRITKPFNNLSASLTRFTPGALASDVNAGSTYGNISWGWTAEEMNTLETDETYALPEENMKILEESGRAGDIETKHGKCFSDEVSQGQLIQDGDLVFDENGNLTSEGDCSPLNTSRNNPEFGDLMLRWRAAQADEKGVDELLHFQELTQPEVSAETAGGGSQFKISSFNILYANSDKGAPWPERLQRSFNVIEEEGLEVIGLQEVRANQYEKLVELGGDKYGFYPTSHSNAYASQNPIMYDKTRFKLVQVSGASGSKMITGWQVHGQRDERANTQVLLEDLATGQQFYVINAHEPVGNNPSSRIQARYDAATHRAEYVKDLANEGRPVFLTGDWNAKYNHEPNQRTYQDKKENHSYCVLTNNTGLWDAYDASVNKTGTCPSFSTKMPIGDGPKGPVDHIYMSTFVQVSKYDYSIGPPGNGSDSHSTLIADVTIPGTQEGAAATFVAGTYNIKHEIQHGGSCTRNACAEQRSQTQANIILGKSGNPAFDIVATQETSPVQHDRFKTMLTDYDHFPKQVPENQGNAIYWNKTKFTLGASGYIDTINNVSKEFQRPWVELKTADGSRSIFVTSAHAPNNNFGNAAGRAKVANDIYTWAQSKVDAADTIIAMGDWNEQPKAANVYCILTKGAVFQDTQDMARKSNPNKPCPHKGAGTIDQIYASPKNGITASDWKHPPRNQSPYSTASDHSPTYVTLSFPGSPGTGAGSSAPIPYTNPVFNANVPDPSVIRADDGTYHVYATGLELQHLTSKDLVSWQRKSGAVVTGAPASATGKMWAPDVAKTGNNYTLSWSGSSGGEEFDIYYATSASAGGPFKYRGKLVSGGYIGTYDLDSNIYMSPDGPILYYGSGGKGITAVKLKISADGQISTTGPKKVLFEANPVTEWIAEGSWMQKNGEYYYLYYSVGRYDFFPGYRDKPAYHVRVARSKSPMGPFEKSPQPVLQGNNTSVSRPGHNSIALDNAGNEWMVYHAYLGSDRSNRKLMIDPITYQANGWPIVNDGYPSLGRQAAGPSNGAGFDSGIEGASGAWVWPLSKNDWNGPFGYNVWGNMLGTRGRHAGVDMSGTGGDKVMAAHSGTVESVKYVSGCKWQVIIKATGTPYWYAYQHMGSVSVKAKNTVKAGAVIGTVDSVGPTGGCGSGAHLHFSVEKANTVSSYSSGANLKCDIDQAACAKQMTSLPPLCFMEPDRNYGTYVNKNNIKGTPYCKEVTGQG